MNCLRRLIAGNGSDLIHFYNAEGIHVARLRDEDGNER